MRDTKNEEANYAELFALASEQHGYFTTAQALAHGISWRLLTHHTKQGRFIRIRRGLVDPDELLEGAKGRSGRVLRLIQSGLAGTER